MLKKIKYLIKNYWYFIALFIVIIFSAIGIDITFNILKERKKEKKKEKIINNNQDQIEKIEKQEKEHEKIITDSNNNYDQLIHGKWKRKKS